MKENRMQEMTVDVAIIGAGTAGLTAYRAARTHGKRVVLIEQGPGGTTCARVGCMPSKLLIAAAESAHAVQMAPAFGVQAATPRIDGQAVMARVRSERDRFVGFVLESVDNIAAEDLLHGHARFIAPKQLQVGQHTVVTAHSFVLASGSRPHVPPELSALGARLVTSDEIFEWTDLPESVAVIGTGVIGLELGQALHRLGVRVALFSRTAKLAHVSDPAVLAMAHRCFGAELDLRLHTHILRAEQDGGGVLLHTRNAGGEHSEHFSMVLAATGRLPNIDTLGIEAAGLTLDRRGVPLCDPHTMRCGDSSIYLAGDVSQQIAVLHEATEQGRIAGDNAARHPHVQPHVRQVPLVIAFSDPQVASVGLGYHNLLPGQYAVGEVSFINQGRSRVMLQNCGLLRVYGERGSNRFLGAEMVGPRAEHLAHLLAWACQSEMTVAQMLGMPFYHPVIEEGVRTALRRLRENLEGGLPPIEHCSDCTPGV
jgi:dihydrolipoamide dehydrogenase